MEVIFKPITVWWNPFTWREEVKLKEGRHYSVINQMITFKKHLKGQIEITYEVK
jgi:hypothetical protein